MNIDFTRLQEKAYNITKTYMNKIKMIPKKDYDIYHVEYCELDYSNSNIVIKLQFEEDPKIVKAMEEIGWIIERRYVNDNGSPSKFCNGEFDDSFGDYGNYKMIRMIVK
ncbi:hypothetical protein ACQPU1_01985 [Clostridium paraputrificum]|uniref:hypothetical protein n=1 Tax=Clostridium paraputrificum TaxID=29363 RepID=UPI003D3566BF